MRQSGTCTKCGGKDVHRFVVGGRGATGLWTGGWVGKFQSWIAAYACATCGFIEMYAEGSGPVPR